MAGVPAIRFEAVVKGMRLLEVIVLCLVLTWSLHYRGGLALASDNKDLIFNVHPVLMVIGLIVLNAEGYNVSRSKKCILHSVDAVTVLLLRYKNGGMLSYKTVSGTKGFRKTVHLLVQLVSFLVSVVGVWAAWKFHIEKSIDNFYSLHSWLGLACMILFSIQWGAGFVTFWYPGGGRNTRMALLPWHVFFGIYLYALAVATAATGILEKATFLQSNKVILRYSTEAMMANCLGLLIVVLGGFVILAIIVPVIGKGDANRVAAD